MVKIATVQTFEAAIEKLIEAWEAAGKPKTVRFEGFDGVGKSSLARIFAERTDGTHIEADRYVTKPEIEKPYRDCIRQQELNHAMGCARDSKQVVILDAVCLEEIAPSARWGRGLVVYIKRLSFNNWDPMWHDGFNLSDELPEREVRRSIHEYHNRVKPHETADVIIEMPEREHSITPGTYSRAFCFDPPDSEFI